MGMMQANYIEEITTSLDLIETCLIVMTVSLVFFLLIYIFNAFNATKS